MAALGYDQVTILHEDGSTQTVTRKEYETLPLAHRVSLVLKQRVQFYRRGVNIAPFEALRVS